MEDIMAIALHRWTVAWFVLSVTLALHIAEEASSGSYLVFGETLDLLRQIFPQLAIPPFQFTVWLIDIVGAILLLLSLTWLVQKRYAIMRPASFALATFATANAMVHILFSLASDRILAGTFTSPPLLVASLFLLLSVPRGDDRAFDVAASGTPTR
jgi:hypothetical protein